jgi:hypothetical protein
MSKLIFKYQGLQFFSLILVVMVLITYRSEAKQGRTIILHDEQVPVTPKEFYINSIVDERDNRSAVAWLLQPGGAGNPPKTDPVDLQGGGFIAIKQFIDHNLPRNKALRPVVILLKKFMVTESALAGGQVEGHIAVVMSFNMEQKDADMLHLVDYKGNATYIRNAGPPQDIEPTLRQTLENGLVYLNTWMNRQAGTNIKLAKAVKISFTDYTEKSEGDTIYYAVTRPLTWDDFQSKIPGRRFDAEVFPTIGYDEHREVVNGMINVGLEIKVCLPKSAAWVKDGNRNDYALNHEQRHFDIVKIAAEHFKKKINPENLTVSNYEGIINVEYLETYREMTNLQKQYDDETRHGADQSTQQRWNERIDKELKECGVKVISH